MKHASALFADGYGTEPMRRIWSERNTVQRWLDVEAAIARAQQELGLLPADVARRIVEGCDVERLSPEAIAAHRRDVGHVMVATMHAFAEACGPAGEAFHLGATTQDVLDTGLVLQVRDAHALLDRDLERLEGSLADLAARHKHTPMIGRTHGQPAAPLTFGFKVVLWLSEIGDHRERLRGAMARLAFSRISGAVGSNASYQILLGPEKASAFRDLVASHLDLGVSALDLHQRTDLFVELVNVLAMIGTTLGRIGLEVRELQRPEIGELEEPLVHATQYGSSTMPTKRNPALSEWLDALGTLLRGNASAIGQVTMQHERDATWLATEQAILPESFLLASASVAKANDVLGGLVVHGDRMRENLRRHRVAAMSEAVMLHLYRRTGRKLEAHRACAEAARDARAQDRSFAEVLLERPEVRGHIDADALEAVLDPERYTGDCASQVDAFLAKRR